MNALARRGGAPDGHGLALLEHGTVGEQRCERDLGASGDGGPAAQEDERDQLNDDAEAGGKRHFVATMRE